MRYSEYVENKKRGHDGFPIQYYYLDSEQPQYIMETHWHTDFEIIRVLSGRFDVYLEDTKYTLHAGDMLFVECGSLHRGIPYDCVYECVVFDIGMLRRKVGDAAERLLTPIFQNTVSVSCSLSETDNSLYNDTAKLFKLLSSPYQYYELYVYSALFSIFYGLYQNGYVSDIVKSKRSVQMKQVSAILDWIDDNYTEKISLSQLEEISGISKKYICRIFKKYTGRSPICYINELRLENACYELAFGDKKITEIAYDNGFEDLSYFSRFFKKCRSMSPLEYRKKHK